MTTQDRAPSRWANLPISLRAVIAGLLVTLAAVNVWPLLLLNLGVPLAAFAEAISLGLFLWWTSGGGPPRTAQAARATAFRRGRLLSGQWFWGVIAALFFAATIHASIVLLFRLVSFPMAAFRHGYDVSFIPTQPLRWLAVVVSATSAGICEETGFRGYMQRPIEQRHGVPVAILISSLFFMALHLTKAWATLGMVPIVFGAGVLLGLLAWSSGSLIPRMIGHVVMDIGLFAYWWTGIAGDFTARTIANTGVDRLFIVACAWFTISLFTVLFAISRLRGRAQIPNTRNQESFGTLGAD
jgi:membrane protease YdiL (CAAX protease family)